MIQLPAQTLVSDSLTTPKVSLQSFCNCRPKTTCPPGTDLPGLTYGAVKRRAPLQHFTTGRRGRDQRLQEPAFASRQDSPGSADARAGVKGQEWVQLCVWKGPSVPTLSASQSSNIPKGVRADDRSFQSPSRRKLPGTTRGTSLTDPALLSFESPLCRSVVI